MKADTMASVAVWPGPSPAGESSSPSRPARRIPLWWRDAAGSLSWASGLIVVALWVADGGLQGIDGLGSGLDSLGRLTGLIAADLLLIQVLLMARIPIIERSYGQDELVRRHRLVGFTSFSLMLAHIALICLGYAVDVHLNVVVETWKLVVGYPGMLLATAGSGLLVMVAVTSVKRARRRLRYESWHLLHLYAYLGAGLALPHQLWTGQEFLDHHLATVYWWTLWAAAAGSMLIWRLIVPLRRSIFHDLRVMTAVPEGPGVVSIWMRGRHLDRLRAEAGQFFTWRFLSGSGWTRGHPYSLSAAPSAHHLRITVKDLGDGSGNLAALPAGTRVLIEGPFGRLHDGVRTRRRVTLLAGGIGVTPLRALLEAMPQKPGDVTLIYRAHSEPELILRGELDRLANSNGARVFYVTGPRALDRPSWLPSSASHLSDVEALRQLLPDLAEQDVYICGAPAWMEAAAAAVLEAGVPKTRIHQERFTW